MNFLNNIKLLPWSLAANAALLVVVGVLSKGLLSAGAKIESEISRCNEDKLQSAIDAMEQRHDIEMAAQARRSVQLASELERARSSLRLAESSATEAHNRAERALEAIRQQAGADPESCGNHRPDSDFWADFRLRDSEGRH